MIVYFTVLIIYCIFLTSVPVLDNLSIAAPTYNDIVEVSYFLMHFLGKDLTHKARLTSLKYSIYLLSRLMFWFQVCLFSSSWFEIVLLLSGDIEKNPGPVNNKPFSVCHWNANSLPAHNYAKITLLEVCS